VAGAAATPPFAALRSAAGGAAEVPDYCAILLALPRLPEPGLVPGLPAAVLASLPVATLSQLTAPVLSGLPVSDLVKLPPSVLSKLPAPVPSTLPTPVRSGLGLG